MGWCMEKHSINTERREIRILLVTVVLVLQLVQIFFCADMKQNYFLDELYSLGYSHSFTAKSGDRVYITDSDDWKYERWISNRVLKEKLETTPEESLLRMPFAKGLKRLLKKRTYFGLLNIIMSVFSPGKVTKMPGILLNIPFFICIQILLYQMCMRFSGNYTCSLLALIMYGFSPAAINMAVFIRFYCMVVFLFMAAVYLHQGIWNSDRAPGILIRTVSSLILLYVAMKDSELILVLGGALIACFALALIVRRRFREGMYYLVSIVPAGLIYVSMKPFLLKIVLHPSGYFGKGWPIGYMSESLLTTPLSERLLQPVKYSKWFWEWMFGNGWIAAAYAVIAGISLYRFIGGKGQRAGTAEEPGTAPGTAPSSDSGTSLGTATSSDSETAQGAVPPSDLETALGTVPVDSEIAQGAAASSEPPLKSRWPFYAVVFAVTAIYLLFYWLVGFVPNRRALRYCFFIFPLISFMIWMGLDSLTRGDRYRRRILAAVTALMLVSFVCSWVGDSPFHYLYPTDVKAIRKVQDNDIRYAIVVCEDTPESMHCSYDCINIMDKDAWICPVIEDQHHIDLESCPDKMYVWGLRNHEPSACTDELTAAGYELRQLSYTHASDIFVAEKKDKADN